MKYITRKIVTSNDIDSSGVLDPSILMKWMVCECEIFAKCYSENDNIRLKDFNNFEYIYISIIKGFQFTDNM